MSLNNNKNFSSEKRVPLKGSEREEISGSLKPMDEEIKSDPEMVLELSLSIRRKLEIPGKAILEGTMTQNFLIHNHGVGDPDLAKMEEFLDEYHLKIVEKHHGASIIKVKGKLSDIEIAFGTQVKNIKLGDQIYRQRTGPITIPISLDQIILGVFGLDNRPQVQPRLKIYDVKPESYSPLDIARLYNFPPGDGNGQTLAIIELGGGYIQEDLDIYFKSLGLVTPIFKEILVSGGENSPTHDMNGPDGEVMLDLEILGALVPKAEIKVYFGPNTDKGFLDAVNEAIHDSPSPNVISISWGGPEGNWTGQTHTSMESAFQTAASMGIPITVASGDGGSTDGTMDLTVDFPASVPYALACGGTHLEGQKTITREVVWNEYGAGSGGGVSNFFSKPDYQEGLANLPKPSMQQGGRGVPDVSGNAAPETGYRVRIVGKDCVVGGTSAVAPLWAGLISRISQNMGARVPFLNPLLYANPGVMNDIIEGNNDIVGIGEYGSMPGWDPCTGLGSPKGMDILNLIKGKLIQRNLSDLDYEKKQGLTQT